MDPVYIVCTVTHARNSAHLLCTLRYSLEASLIPFELRVTGSNWPHTDATLVGSNLKYALRHTLGMTQQGTGSCHLPLCAMKILEWTDTGTHVHPSPTGLALHRHHCINPWILCTCCSQYLGCPAATLGPGCRLNLRLHRSHLTDLSSSALPPQRGQVQR